MFFKKKKKNNEETEIPAVNIISSHDTYGLIREDNKLLLKIIMAQSVALVVLVATVYFLKDPKIKILRMYDNPEANETIMIDSGSDNRIRKQDILLLVKYIVEHLDLKSTNALGNYDKLMSISQGIFLKELQNNQDKVLNASSNSLIDKTYNSVLNSKIVFNKETRAFIVEVNYQQINVLKDGSQKEETKLIKLALKPVNRADYASKLNLGGWYYGLMLDQIDANIDSI